MFGRESVTDFVVIRVRLFLHEDQGTSGGIQSSSMRVRREYS